MITFSQIYCVSYGFATIWGSLSSTAVKNLPLTQELQEMQFQSLGQDDPLKKGMATHNSILAWRIPWTEEPGGLQSIESQRVGHNWSDYTHMHMHTCCYINAK